MKITDKIQPLLLVSQSDDFVLALSCGEKRDVGP
jgi:hypothetical protein